jgi:hypothetical protein
LVRLTAASRQNEQNYCGAHGSHGVRHSAALSAEKCKKS